MWWVALAAAAPVTLGEAIERGSTANPAAVGAAASADAARARSVEARWALVPDLSVGGSATWGTGNVVAGPSFPLLGVPQTAGPPLDPVGAPAANGLVAATARVGLGDLPERLARVDAALARERSTDALARAAALEAGWSAGMAWVDLAEATDGVGLAEVDLAAAREVERRARALVDGGVRPGVERALAASATAASEARLVEARAAVAVAGARLSAALGGGAWEAAPGALGRATAPADGAPPALAAATEARASAVAAARAERAAFWPRVDLVAATWARGGGWPGPASAVPDVGNWAVGATASWSVLDLPEVSSRARAARADADAAAAAEEALRLAIAAQVAEAAARVVAADERRALVPARLAATDAALREAGARYEAGLADLAEVELARALDRAARAEDVAARAAADRAALTLAWACGDLSAVSTAGGAP